MRIFLGFQQSTRRHAVPAYAFWERYLKSALAEAGHEWLEAPLVDWAEGLRPLAADQRAHWLDLTWSRTVDHLRAEHARRPVHLALFYLFPSQVEPAAVRTISGLGLPTVNFFCDNVREFTTVPAAFRPFDLHWVPEYEALPHYAAAGLPHLHAPMPLWVDPVHRHPPETETTDLTFIGSHDILREDLLAQLVARGLPLRLHGAGWMAPGEPPAVPDGRRGFLQTLANQKAFFARHGGRGLLMRATYQLHRRRDPAWIGRHWSPLESDDAYTRALRESQIVLGINRYPGFRHSFRRPGRYSRLRDLEAPMLGACYLTEYAPGLEQLYDLATEILSYRNLDELIAQVDGLRRDPGRRRSLRHAGQRRALTDHTIARTLTRIAGRLGLA